MGFSKVVLPACMAFFLFSLQFLLSLFFNDHQTCKISLNNFLAKWWAYLDLNQGPRPYQGRALTN